MLLLSCSVATHLMSCACAGCGLVGLCLASFGCDVTLTDLADVVPLLESNVAYNVPAAAASTHSWGTPACAVLQWGVDDLAAFSPPYDFIVGSDIVYSESLILPLLQTIKALASHR